MNPSETTRRRVAVLGGGISGLTAAYTLAQARRAGAPVEEILIEGQQRLGGVIHTERAEGFIMEAGPDSFLSEKREAALLCQELGLGESLLGSNDNARRTFILHRGRLLPLPDGLMLMVPSRLCPVMTTALLPWSSKLRIAAEWFHAAPPNPARAPADESVASFVTRHFGSAMLENIADPLLAGVYGGDSASLSARSVLPRFWEMERKSGSLVRAVIGQKKQRGESSPEGDAESSRPQAPLFTTLKDGLDRLVSRLEEELDGSRVHRGQRAMGIEPLAESAGGPSKCRYRIRSQGNIVNDVDAVILALPAHECARLVVRVDSALAESLNSIPYSSAVTVTLGYADERPESLPPGFGFLVPRRENRRLLACTFVHQKFAHRAAPGRALLRCFLGGSRDPGVLALSDDEIVSIVRRELCEILDWRAEPAVVRVFRWPSSMAQYAVGHEERLAEIQKRLRGHPGIFLAGNAYSGIGISDCIRTGKTAAQQALL